MEQGFRRLVDTKLPTRQGQFQMMAYGYQDTELYPDVALWAEPVDIKNPVLVRIHSECMTGDVFGSSRCDCGEQLEASLHQIAQKGGVLIYLRQEGRGIGLVNKLKAYNLQDKGLNTAEANTHLGFEVDSRSYEHALFILQDLGIQRIRLLTNNPEKIHAFSNTPIEVVQRIPLVIPPKQENEAYLLTKKKLMGHLF